MMAEALPSRGAEAEADYVRMTCLAGMRPSEIARLMAGEPGAILPWLRAAARYGVAEAQLWLGQLLLDGAAPVRDEAPALRWFMRSAEAGSADAMNMAGRCFELGWGAPADAAAAADWYRRSAEAGAPWGQYNYANMLFEGIGLPQDRQRAVAWWRVAAVAGHAPAMSLLSRCLEEGWGVTRDLAEASRWRRLAAEGGYFRAQFNHACWLTDQAEVEAAVGWFRSALANSPAQSRRAMAQALLAHPDARLSALGRAHPQRSAA